MNCEDNFVSIYNKLACVIMNEKNIGKYDDFVVFDYLKEDDMDNFIKNNNDLNKTIVFDTATYIFKNLESYNFNKMDIWKQFELDCCRSNLFINHKRIMNKNDFSSKLKKYSKSRINVYNYSVNSDIMLAMLSTQSSYAYPYILLNNILDKGLVATNSSNNRKIEYQTNGDNINIMIETDFIIRKLETGNEMFIVNCVIMLEMLEVDDQLKLCKNGILSITK